MAVWHFKFGLIPNSGLRRVLGRTDDVVVPEHVSHPDGPRYLEPDELAALPNYWDDPSMLRQVAMVVSSFMPEMKSWSEKARMFGDDEDDRVEVWEDDVSCRIHLGHVDFELLEQILGLARRFDCKLVIHGTGAVTNPDLESLRPHVEASNAYKFCADPERYLRALGETGGREE